MNKIALYTIILIHHILILIIITLPLWSWLIMSAWLACILSAASIWRISSHAKCPLTVLENKIRKQLGLKTIKGFIGHYYIKTYYNLTNK